MVLNFCLYPATVKKISTKQQKHPLFVILKTNNNGEYILISQKRLQSF